MDSKLDYLFHLIENDALYADHVKPAVEELAQLRARIVEAREELRSTTLNWQEDCLFRCDEILTAIIGDEDEPSPATGEKPAQ